MKKIALLLLASYCLLSTTFVRFRSELPQITKTYVHVPAGTSSDGHAISDFYISSIEVTNKQYTEFLNDLKAQGKTAELQTAMVDTTKWRTALHPTEPFVDYYFQHPAYADYPVVNVSKEAAQLYCDWLTDKYNARSESNRVRFALPTQAQWIYAARGGRSSAIYPWDGDSVTYQKKGKFYNTYLCNFHAGRAGGKAPKETADTSAIDITAPSRSYMPNEYGIYNMSGNVAEMVSDRSEVLGGSWDSRADKIKIGATENIPLPAPTVGFRPVMIVE